MIDWYPVVVIAHIVGAIGFILAHGVSAFVAFRVRSAQTAGEVGNLMDLSGRGLTVAYPSLLLLLVAGIAAGFMGDWWGSLWIWLSIGLLVAIAVAMYAFGTTYYIKVRHAAGKTAPQDPKDAPPPTPLPPDELARLLDSRRPEILLLIGGGGLAVIIWLMFAKPL